MEWADGFLMASLWWADGFQGEWLGARPVAADPTTSIVGRLVRVIPDADSVLRGEAWGVGCNKYMLCY
jgi:hypothetical protein